MCGIAAVVHFSNSKSRPSCQQNTYNNNSAPIEEFPKSTSVSQSLATPVDPYRRLLKMLSNRGPTSLSVIGPFPLVSRSGCVPCDPCPASLLLRVGTIVGSDTHGEPSITIDETAARICDLDAGHTTTAASLSLIGAVLHLRGDCSIKGNSIHSGEHVNRQPMQSSVSSYRVDMEGSIVNMSTPIENDNIIDKHIQKYPTCLYRRPLLSSPSHILWNGEVFGGTLPISPSSCDTDAIFASLLALENSAMMELEEKLKSVTLDGSVPTLANDSYNAAVYSVCECFLRSVRGFFEDGAVEGPYAFVYNAGSLSSFFRAPIITEDCGIAGVGGGFLVFGRDPIGRRSLVVSVTDSTLTDDFRTSIVISSLAVGNQPQSVLSDIDTGASCCKADEEKECSSPATFLSDMQALLGRIFRQGGTNTSDNKDVDTGLCGSKSVGKEGCVFVREVPTDGIYSLRMSPITRDNSITTVGEMACSHWSFSNSTHPLLKVPSLSSQGTKFEHKLWQRPYTKNILDSIHHAPLTYSPVFLPFDHGSVSITNRIIDSVGYVYNPSIDCPLDIAKLYLYALSDAVHKRVSPNTRVSDYTNYSSESLIVAGEGTGAATTLPTPPPVLVLFSGGIDCTILAALTHYHLPLGASVELANVAFSDHCRSGEGNKVSSLGSKSNFNDCDDNSIPSRSQVRRVNVGTEEKDSFFSAPDRVAAYHSLLELCALPRLSAVSSTSSSPHTSTNDPFPFDNRFKLVEVNVTREELAKKQEYILELISPRATVMDHNIGCAIWFAARGIGMHIPVNAVKRVVDAWSRFSGGTSKLIRRRHISSVSVDVNEETSAVGMDTEEPYSALVKLLIQEGATRRRTEDGVMGAAGSTDENRPSTSSAGGSFVYIPAQIMISTLGKEYGDVLKRCWRSKYKKLGQYLQDAAKDGVIKIGNNGTLTGKYVQLCRSSDISSAINTTKERLEASSGCNGDVEGIVRDSNKDIPHVSSYTCQSRVVLLGMGADETMGGYIRHQRVLAREGADGLEAELQRDFERLWERNLGRDDRVVSDSGREGRFPFLDEGVLQVLACIGREGLIKCVCEFEGGCGIDDHDDGVKRTKGQVGPGVGDKKILRTVARMIGLKEVSELQKRAIQFGSRIADRRERGSWMLHSE